MPEQEPPPPGETAKKNDKLEPSCPCCGGRMIMIEIFEPGTEPTGHHQRAPPKLQSLMS